MSKILQGKSLRAALLAAVFTAQPAGNAWADGNVELVEIMSTLQYFAHKTALSIDSKNKPLTEFYTHELEEYLEQAAEVETYDGHPVGELAEKIAMPSFEKFEAAVKDGDWKKISSRFDEVINSCNSCHSATDHGFITIERRTDNPYMQTFKASKR